MALGAGDKLGPYEIVGPIGKGGMGEVYRATDTRLNRDVAIKVSAQQFSDRFEREARAVASLNHPNICTLYDVGPNYLVMELVDGESLAEQIHKGTIPLDEALAIARQIAEGLEAAHESGIIHRDLKPGNVKIKPDGTVKVLDFGLAKLAEPKSFPRSDPEHSPTVTLEAGTRAGTILGTAAYMSPEQAAGKPTDRRADVWAFGVVLWEMLTGRRLFRGESTTEILSQVLLGEVDLDKVPPETPEPIRELLRRCLDRQVKNRLRDIGEARYALSRPLEAPSPRVSPFPTRGWRFVAAWLGLAALVMVVATLGLYRLSSQPEGSAARRLLPFATEEFGESKPFWSPDGQTIAYVATIDGKDRIYTRALTAKSAFPVAQCPAICDVVGWSGDGSRVYYQSRTTHLDARIWSVARFGGAPVPAFPDDVTVLASAVSPDGKRLAMIRIFMVSDGGRRATLFLSEPPGATPVRLEAFPSVLLVQPHAIAWFADSARLLVYSPPRSKIFLVSTSKRLVRDVAAQVPFVPGLTWSGDPKFAVAAISSTELGASGLYWLNVDTGALSPLRLFELPVVSPAVARDGRRLAYTVAEKDFDLMEIPLNGSPIRPLLASRLSEHSARYSPLSDVCLCDQR